MGFEALQNIVADCAVQNPMQMIGGPEKEGQTGKYSLCRQSW
jgi:hypothetical protein